VSHNYVILMPYLWCCIVLFSELRNNDVVSVYAVATAIRPIHYLVRSWAQERVDGTPKILGTCIWYPLILLEFVLLHNATSIGTANF